MQMCYTEIAILSQYLVLSTLRPARCYQHGAAGPWHLPLVVSGGVCWWREMMTKCF